MEHTKHPLRQYLPDCPGCQAMSAKKKLWYRQKLWYELCDLVCVAPDTPLGDVQAKIGKIYDLAFTAHAHP